jgi:hypothetical protein
MRAHRLVMVGVALAMVAGCGGYRAGSAPAPRVAATDSTPASMLDRSERSRSRMTAPRKKGPMKWKTAKGIGASGGPAGREDLRPGKSP